MESQLLPGTKLNDRYQVIKTVVWRVRGGVYEVWDFKVTDRRWLVKEIIPPPMAPDELEKRKQYFYESLEDLKNLQHSNLARIVDNFSQHGREYVVIEYIDGITFKHFMGVIERLPERQVLEIGFTLCDAIEYLHDRPKPLVFESLDYEHVMLDYEKTLKFVGYDLTKFFFDDFPYAHYADSPEQIENSIFQVSKVLLYLLSGMKEVEGREMPEEVQASEEFASLLEKTLNPHQKMFSSIGEFRTAIDRIYDPEKYKRLEEEARKRRKAREIKIPSFDELKQIPARAYAAFIGQRRQMLFIELVALIVISFTIFMINLNSKPVYKPPGDVNLLYVTAGNKIYTINETTMYVLDKRDLEFTPGCAFYDSSKETLLLCDTGQSYIYLVNPRKNEVLDRIEVDVNPSEIIGDGAGYLFVLHRGGDTITALRSFDLIMRALIPVGIDSWDMDYLPRNKMLVVSNKGTSDIALIHPKTFKLQKRVGFKVDVEYFSKLNMQIISKSPNGEILYTDPKNNEVKKIRVKFQPSKMLASADGKYLFVADSDKNYIKVLRTDDEFRQIGLLNDLGGKGISDMVLDAKDPSKIWISFEESHSISLYDTNAKKLIYSYKIGKAPCKMIWGSNREKIWLIDRGTNEVIVFLPYSQIIDRRISLDNKPVDIIMLPPLNTIKKQEK